MKQMLTKNEFVAKFLKERYDEAQTKFQQTNKIKGAVCSFGTTVEGKKLLMRHALAMYQLYLGTAGLYKEPKEATNQNEEVV